MADSRYWIRTSNAGSLLCLCAATFIAAMATALVAPPVAAHTLVRMQTTLGALDIELFDNTAPLTVANFLQYVKSGAYDTSIIHRSAPGFVLQGGGYRVDSANGAISPLPTTGPVINEYNPAQPNARGTLAMAKRSGAPDSATSQWFINLSDNSSYLGGLNGGFTVFGKVIGDGMSVVDAIAGLPVMNAGGDWASLPVVQIPANGILQTSDMVVLNNVKVLASTPVISPETGWWWNPTESGRGFSIEVSSGSLFMATFLYDNAGRAIWYATGGPLNSDGSYTGQLQEYAGGQTLTGSYQAASIKGSPSDVSLTCSSSALCRLDWAGGSVPIQRFVFDSAATPASVPQTGWWWNPDETGRGYFLEMQGNSLFATSYMYDDKGNALWYLTSGPILASRFAGSWTQYANGQTMAGRYIPAALTNDAIGLAIFDFLDSTHATLTLPNGRQIALTRFPVSTQ